MIQTVIITFLLIAAMFYFTQESESEEHGIGTKVEHQEKENSEKKESHPETASLLTKSLSEDDSAKDVGADYTSVHSVTHPDQTGISKNKSILKEIKLESPEVNVKESDETVVGESSSEEKNDTNIIDIPKVVEVLKVETKEKEKPSNVDATAKVIEIPKAVEAVETTSTVKSVKVEKIEIPEIPNFQENDIPLPEVPTIDSSAIELPMKIELPEVPTLKTALLSSSTENDIKVPNTSLNKVTVPTVPNLDIATLTPITPLYDNESDIEVQLKHEREAKNRALAVNKTLSFKLLEEELKGKSLEEKLNIIRDMAEKGEIKARAEEKRLHENRENLLNKKDHLEKELASEQGDKKKLELQKHELEARIKKMLQIAKDATVKAEEEYASLMQRISGLEEKLLKRKEKENFLEQKSEIAQGKIEKLLAIAKKGTQQAEKEFNAKVQENVILKSKINKLLEIAKEGTQQAEIEFKAKVTENTNLREKIQKLLDIAKVGTQKAEAEFQAKKEANQALKQRVDRMLHTSKGESEAQLQKILTSKQELEQKLSNELATEKALKKKNKTLEGTIEKLLFIAKEGTQKAEAEFNTKVAENIDLKAKIEKLLSIAEKGTKQAQAEFDAKEREKNELQEKIEKILSIAKEGTQKAEIEFNKLVASKKSLEENLEEELVKEESLKEEKEELQSKINKLLSIAEKGTKQAEIEFNKLVASKKSLEESLTAEISKEEGLEEQSHELQSKIDKILSIAKKGTQKAEAEFSKLVSSKKSLEVNLAEELVKEESLKEKNTELQSQINKILSIAKEGTQKAEIEFTKLISSKESLESTLTDELAKENILKERNNQLHVKIETLLAIGEEKRQKAMLEFKAKEQENTILKGKIERLLDIAKKGTEKAQAEFTLKIEEINNLQSNQSVLREEKIQLQEKLKNELLKEDILFKEREALHLKIVNLEATLAESKQEATSKIQGLLSTQKSLKTNLTSELDHEKELRIKTKALEIALVDLKAEDKTLKEKLAKEIELKKEIEKRLADKREEIESVFKEKFQVEVNAKTAFEKLTKEKKDAVGAREKEIVSLESSKKALEEENAQLQKSLEETKEKEQMLINEKSELEKKINIIEPSLSKATKSFQTEVQGLLSSKMNLEKSLEEELEQKNTLLKQQESLSSEFDALKVEDEKLKLKLIQELKAKEETQSLLAKTKEKVNLLAQAQNKAQEESQKVQAQLDDILVKKERLEKTLKEELEKEQGLTSAKVQAENQIQTLLSTAKEGTLKAETEFNAKIEENLALKAKIDELLKSKEEETSKAQAQIEKLEQASKKAEKEALEAKEQIESLQAERKKSQKKSQKLLDEKALAEKLAALAKAAQERYEAEAEEKAKAQKIEEAKREEARQKAEIAQAKRRESRGKLLETFTLTNVKFKYNSMELTDNSKTRLEKTAKLMMSHPEFIYKMQGHTDSMGKESYNIKLSTKRANKVKAYLVDQGVEEFILETEGVGSILPIADNSTKEGREKNRRVVFLIVN